MTIARRLIVLLAVPLLTFFGLGLFMRAQLARIEDRTRFVAESRVVALARLGDISRSFTELRVNLRSQLLAKDDAERARARAAFDEDRAELSRLLADYADRRSTSDHGRRLLNDFRTGSERWVENAEAAMAMADAGRQEEATALLFGPSIAGLGVTVSKVSLEWIKYNEQIATDAGQAALTAIDNSQTQPAGRGGGGAGLFRAHRLPHISQHRHADQGTGSVGQDDCCRRLRRGRSVHVGDRRNRWSGAFD